MPPHRNIEFIHEKILFRIFVMLVFSLSCSLKQLKNLHWITETACMINSPSFVFKKVQRYVIPWSKQNSYQISVQLNAKSSWFSFLYSNLPGFWPCDAFWFPVQHLLKLWNRDGSRAHPFCQVMVETQHLKQDKSKLNTRNTNTVTFKDNWNKQNISGFGETWMSKKLHAA